jgi:cytidylate kinase
MRKITIAIDGPAASGKSTVAKEVAKALNYIYIDSGAMYRALTLKALRSNIDVKDEASLVEMTKVSKITLDGVHIYLDDEDVSEAIRSIDVTNNVSAVSSYEGVREEMVNLQKEYGKKGGIVMDGRDIGTTVFPNAELKIFQIASVEERANRRYKENMRKGIACDLNTLKEEIKVRDFKDSTRSVSPLRKASDAIELDTSNLEPKEVVDKIIELARKIIESEE